MVIVTRIGQTFTFDRGQQWVNGKSFVECRRRQQLGEEANEYSTAKGKKLSRTAEVVEAAHAWRRSQLPLGVGSERKNKYFPPSSRIDEVIHVAIRQQEVLRVRLLCK